MGDEGRDEGLLFEEKASKADKELGAYLREERLRHQVSLQEMADTTRIKLRYLEAIEEGEFGKIPADPIVKGFLRAYARHIGIDDNAVVERYAKLHGHPSLDVQGLGRDVIERGRRGGGRLKVVLAILLFFVAGTIFYFVQSYFRREPIIVTKQEAPPARDLQPAEEPRAKVRVPASKEPSLPDIPSGGRTETEVAAPGVPSDRKVTPSPAKPARPAASPSPEAASPGKPSPPTPEVVPPKKPSPPKGPMVLAVKAIEDTWLRVVADETSQYEVLLSAGNSREWQAKEKFVITIGNVAGTRVSLNGQEVTFPPTSTNVIHDFTLTKRPQS